MSRKRGLIRIRLLCSYLFLLYPEYLERRMSRTYEYILCFLIFRLFVFINIEHYSRVFISRNRRLLVPVTRWSLLHHPFSRDSTVYLAPGFWHFLHQYTPWFTLNKLYLPFRWYSLSLDSLFCGPRRPPYSSSYTDFVPLGYPSPFLESTFPTNSGLHIRSESFRTIP